MTVLTGIDVSHFQGAPNLAAFKAAGGAFVFAKATESTTFVDPEYATNRANAHAAGLVFGSYHFARLTDPIAEADFYLAHATPQPGELVALDMEVNVAGVEPVAWCLAWLQHVKAATGAAPVIYLNQSLINGHNWGPVVANDDGLWLAKYDGVQSPMADAPWAAVAFKQFSDSGVESGVAGRVDVDDFFGDLATLQKYTVPPGGSMTTVDLSPASVAAVALAVWGFKTSGQNVQAQDRLTGDDSIQLPGIKAEVDALKAEEDQVVTALDALTAAPGAPVTIDQAAADLIAASLVANPQFQAVVASAATAVVAQMDSDLANRFGPKQ